MTVSIGGELQVTVLFRITYLTKARKSILNVSPVGSSNHQATSRLEPACEPADQLRRIDQVFNDLVGEHKVDFSVRSDLQDVSEEELDFPSFVPRGCILEELLPDVHRAYAVAALRHEESEGALGATHVQHVEGAPLV